MIKAVFIDIDGTLTNSQRKVTKKTKLEIANCVRNGVKIILTSGRSRMEVMDFQMAIGASPYIISSNGASAYDIESHKEIYNERIAPEMVLDLINYARKNGHTIKLNYGNTLIMNQAVYDDEKPFETSYDELERVAHDEQVVQCVVNDADFKMMNGFREYVRNECQRLTIVNESKRFKNLDLKPSRRYYCDVTYDKVSKGRAVKAVCEYLGIDADEIITIGDGENDLSMFDQTPNSVAMENALPMIKKKARYVTASNDDDGVAEVLAKLY